MLDDGGDGDDNNCRRLAQRFILSPFLVNQLVRKLYFCCCCFLFLRDVQTSFGRWRDVSGVGYFKSERTDNEM